MKASDYVRASRKGSREAELESENGFKAVLKVHKSKKAYTRKLKYKDNYRNFPN